jgi:hypothetical protein
MRTRRDRFVAILSCCAVCITVLQASLLRRAGKSMHHSPPGQCAETSRHSPEHRLPLGRTDLLCGNRTARALAELQALRNAKDFAVKGDSWGIG